MPKKKEAAPVVISFPERYQVLGADLSLRRPGFALLDIEDKDGKATILNVKLMSVDTKTKKNLTHGQILTQIYHAFIDFLGKDYMYQNIFYVREKMVMSKKVPSERDVAKVVGLMDFLLDTKAWNEIYPSTIKKHITGSGNAEKSLVAECLREYVGVLDYKNDDESDATAVAISWLIERGKIRSAFDGE